jgi:[ribosomal protein S18]-alanine N-acetyltransferase
MYILRYMTVEDIPQVLEIDRLSFALPWSPRSYEFEINDNPNGHMVVLAGPGLDDIAGYGGMWMIDGEAHISTIATHPDVRGHNLGEALLAGMLSRAILDNAEYSVLEVRVSNVPAISLYEKYEYEVVGRRKGYYRDNNEDAYLMHLAPIDAAYHARFAERLRRLSEQVSYMNLLAQETGRPPRQMKE